MTITLYELACANPEQRISPYCWRVQMALKHKGLAFDSQPWRFTEKDRISFSNQGKVPVLVDDGQTVTDSWAIAEYLDRAYPATPRLFENDAQKHFARFIKYWCETVVQPALVQMILVDIYQQLDPKDQSYFRSSREKMFGMPLEQVVADREAKRLSFAKTLSPARAMLSDQPFLNGDTPGFADYILFGALQWARTASSFEVLGEDDSLRAWRDRMLGLYGGYAASYPVPEDAQPA